MYDGLGGSLCPPPHPIYRWPWFEFYKATNFLKPTADINGLSASAPGQLMLITSAHVSD